MRPALTLAQTLESLALAQNFPLAPRIDPHSWPVAGTEGSHCHHRSIYG